MTPTDASLVALGGAPLFVDRVRPIGQLSAPPMDAFLGQMRRQYDPSYLPGAAVSELEAALANLHEVSFCIACSNACVGLIALTELLANRASGEVILPAFTYVGLPHLVQWSGHQPRFCDVGEDSHALDADAVRAAINDETALILGVHQVNAPCSIDALQALSEETGVPLIFDAVHGLYNTHRGRPIGNFGRAEVFSLHATKMLNGFEGGYITTNDAALAAALRQLLNHGRRPDGRVGGLGLNGQLSDVHAAFALAGIDGVAAASQRNFDRYRRYQAGVSKIAGLSVFPYPENGERFNYEFTLVEVHPAFGINRDRTVELLLQEGTRARAYYGPPVHLTSHRPPEQAAPHLPVTEALAERFIQMPVGEHVSLDDIDRICQRMAQMHAHAAQLSDEASP